MAILRSAARSALSAILPCASLVARVFLLDRISTRVLIGIAIFHELFFALGIDRLALGFECLESRYFGGVVIFTRLRQCFLVLNFRFVLFLLELQVFIG